MFEKKCNLVYFSALKKENTIYAGIPTHCFFTRVGFIKEYHENILDQVPMIPRKEVEFCIVFIIKSTKIYFIPGFEPVASEQSMSSELFFLHTGAYNVLKHIAYNVATVNELLKCFLKISDFELYS